MNKDKLNNTKLKVQSLWGKKSDREGVFKWLPLRQHLFDTMNVSLLLWNHWLSNGQKQLIMNSITLRECKIEDELEREETAIKLIKFIGGIHDLGKAIPAFQAKENPFHNSIDLDKCLLLKLSDAGFRDLEKYNAMSREKTHHALATQAILNDFGLQDDITAILGGHHGKPVDDKTTVDTQLKSYKANYYQSEKNDSEEYIEWKNVQKELFKQILEKSKFESIDEIPCIKKPAQVILSGLLIMADWISSNESFFPLISIDDDGENLDQKKRIKEGWNKWFKTRVWEAKNIYDIKQIYKDRFSFEPRRVQEALGNIMSKCSKPGIFILEAPMGVGKTEAALIAVEQLAEMTGASGMFFGMPTQATANGIFNRINKWILNITEEYGEKHSMQLIHGKAYLNKDFDEIAQNIDYDGIDESGIIVNQWFAGKKTAILDDFTVGTVDKFLLSALKRKHLALSHLGLTKKIIVIDEVHAYDAYMSQYLNRAVRWMGAYGVSVVILSATLPTQKRKELIENYIRGSGKKIKNIEKPEKWEEINAYPLITYVDGDSIKQNSEMKMPIERKIEIIKIEDKEIKHILEDNLSEGGVAGIVVNTVKRAQEIAKELKSIFGDDVVDLLHSAFISFHRAEKEEKLIKTIGKGGKRPRKKIVVGTQVLEQSLDIDFDVMISDLAPMDLLIQRVGRLHRHKNEGRPQKTKNPKLFILGTSENFDFEEGGAYIYGKYLLIRTQYFISDTLVLPDDISQLVQKTYNQSKLMENEDIYIELSDDLKDKYKNAYKEFYFTIEEKKRRATNYILDEPKHEGNLIGWLKFEKSDIEGLAQVRDGIDSIEVIVVKKVNGGYSFVDGNKDISEKLYEKDTIKKLASQTIRLPSIFSKEYNIDETIKFLEKYNRINLASWQEQSWLKGSLGIILDEEMKFYINDWELKYCQEYGLTYKRMVNDEKI